MDFQPTIDIVFRTISIPRATSQELDAFQEATGVEVGLVLTMAWELFRDMRQASIDPSGYLQLAIQRKPMEEEG